MTDSSSAERRLMLYGVSTVLIAVLLVIGFVLPKFTRPEPGTLFGMVELHLGMAEVLPNIDKHGKRLGFKDDHLLRAEKILDDIEDQAPGLGITSEYRAFASWIRGEFDDAKSHYLQALSRYEGNEELCNKTLVNLAQVEFLIDESSKDTTSVVAFLDKVPAKKRGADWYGLAAKVHHRNLDTAKRSEALLRAIKAAGTDQKSLKATADIAYAVGDDMALSAYEKLDPKPASVWYRIAKLEFARGEADRALTALETARKQNAGLFVRLLSADTKLLENEKVRQLLEAAKKPKKPAKPAANDAGTKPVAKPVR